MNLPLTISDFQKLYKEKTEPEHIIRLFWERLHELGTGPTGDTAVIYLPLWDEVSIQLQNLKKIDSTQAPLFGIPFAVKDNIDIEGWPTTAACPSFSYTATSTAYVVNKLRSAGAIVLAKTNLDQFATGLVGTRSP
ncbi:MAG: amidase family protein, partial [Burkholderiaceae bacterium]